MCSFLLYITVNQLCIYTYCCSLVSKSYLTLAIPWTVAHQDPLSMGFSGQEYWSGLLCPPPGNLPNSEIELCLLRLLQWQTGSLPLAPVVMGLFRFSISP